MCDPLREYVGAMHIHSTYSDGHGRVPDILEAARRAGLDFALLTDHDTAAARREGWEGCHHGVTLVVGVEITPPRSGHCLALGIRQCPGFARLPEQEYLDRIIAEGGFAVVAHPLGKVKRSLGIQQRPWTLWHHPAVRGLEIWSYMHDWIDKLQGWKFHEFYDFWRRPHERIVGPAPELLALWDRLCQVRRYVIVPGIDCHARQIPLTRMIVFPYEDMFRTLRMHLFLRCAGEPPGPAQVLEGIREGWGFVGYDLIHDSTGTRFEACCVCGAQLGIGDEHPHHGKVELLAQVPASAELRLLRDGRPIARAVGCRLAHSSQDAGVYRLECYLGGRPWVFTNPIYLRAGREQFTAR